MIKSMGHESNVLSSIQNFANERRNN